MIYYTAVSFIVLHFDLFVSEIILLILQHNLKNKPVDFDYFCSCRA